jgi:hypothetical protein
VLRRFPDKAEERENDLGSTLPDRGALSAEVVYSSSRQEVQTIEEDEGGDERDLDGTNRANLQSDEDGWTGPAIQAAKPNLLERKAYRKVEEAKQAYRLNRKPKGEDGRRCRLSKDYLPLRNKPEIQQAAFPGNEKLSCDGPSCRLNSVWHRLAACIL